MSHSRLKLQKVREMSALERELIGKRMPPIMSKSLGQKSGQKCRNRLDYSPNNWSQYFDTKEDLKIENDSFRVYMCGINRETNDSIDNNRPLLVLLHGGGYCSLTWSLFAKEVQQLCHCSVLAIDMRGHGNTYTNNDLDLSAETLTNDIYRVITTLFNYESIPQLILIGHSMGGAIAVHCSSYLHELIPRIIGLVVIDVVEGTALDALHSMQSFLRGRPKQFSSLQNAIEWCFRSGQTRNIEAARVSMPGQLKNIRTGLTATSELEPDFIAKQVSDDENRSYCQSLVGIEDRIIEEEEGDNDSTQTDDKFRSPVEPQLSGYTWRTDLTKSEPYWNKWFDDLSNMFLSCSADAKLLLLAGIDRLDRALTVGQMQGRFQMQVLPKCGHTVQEDAPDRVAQVIASFLIRNRFTQSKIEFERPFPSC